MFLVSKIYAYTQKVAEDFGYRHLMFKYQNDPVDVIVISKKGEERIAKPLMLFCQGSLPQPVIKYDEKGLYGTLPFNEAPFLEEFHIVIFSTPFIPVIANVNKLGKDFMYFKDFEKEIPPKGYMERNYLDYYVFRNNFILKQLFKERWVRTSKLVVAGHSEGSSIAAKMASLNKKITHLIYSGGNPYGRIASMLASSKQLGKSEGKIIDYWKEAVANCNDTNTENGESFKAAYSFSAPQRDNLLTLAIPVLVTYGNKDCGSAYMDLFCIESIREKKKHITFIDYPELECHFTINSTPRDPEKHYWDEVASDWLQWLSVNQLDR